MQYSAVAFDPRLTRISNRASIHIAVLLILLVLLHEHISRVAIPPINVFFFSFTLSQFIVEID
jgi:hypothetical protein